jgi:hypothetical protein
MTEERARQTANVVMAAAALGAAVFVLRSPKLRRIAWQLARQYAGGPLAAWTASTVRDAWDQSASSASPNAPPVAGAPAEHRSAGFTG